MAQLRFYMALTLSLVVINNIFTQDKVQMFDDFKSSDWKKVKESKSQLENMQGKIIPDIFEMFNKNEKVGLENTGSLIYPGAKRFFGHGQIIEYDVDYISIRAGWLLEDITFNNFGFSGVHLPKDEAIDFIKITFPEYYNNSGNRKKLESSSDSELRDIILNQSIGKAKKWWDERKNNFNRLQCLVEGLKSYDERRQVKALFYMRNGTTKCKGLTTEFYDDVLIKEVSRLSRSSVKRISEHAKLIMLDTSLDWLEIKEK